MLIRPGFIVLLTALLSGCATFSEDGGFSKVQQSVQEKLGQQAVWPRTGEQKNQVQAEVERLLAQDLTAESAVQIALLNNARLQASYYELGISEADFVQAGRLPNPGFSFGRLQRGSEVEYERSAHFNLARLFLMPLVREVESRRFAQTQQTVIQETLSLAAATRKAFYEAVAAQESVRYMQQVRDAAEAGAELARRMAAVGNWNRLQQAREQEFYADSALSLARAEQLQNASRERLLRLLGVWGQQTTRVSLPLRLPDLPAQVRAADSLEQAAMQQRLDVQAAVLGSEQMAKNLGMTRTNRFINVLEIGVVNNSSNEAPVQRGYEISLELPLFDWGGARVAKSEALYQQALLRTRDTAIAARSEVREAYVRYRSSYDIARHYHEQVLPLKQRISEENVLRYNAMLIGVFDLLADARLQINSVNAYINALKDFWLASADLDMSMVGKSTPSSLTAPAMPVVGAPAGH